MKGAKGKELTSTLLFFKFLHLFPLPPPHPLCVRKVIVVKSEMQKNATSWFEICVCLVFFFLSHVLLCLHGGRGGGGYYISKSPIWVGDWYTKVVTSLTPGPTKWNEQ